LLIEAGPRYPAWALHAPLAGLRLRTAWSWPLESVPQQQLNGRRIAFPMGRMIGGTSSVNAMVAAVGPAADHDAWGIPGWSWADLRPCLERAASLQGGSMLPVNQAVYESAFSTAFLRACEEDGLQRVGVFDGSLSETCGLFALFQDGGSRSSAARYLNDVGRDGKLSILPRTEVRRVLFAGQRAVGVEFGRRHATGQVFAADGVVLCAGALLSPNILHRSGVGPAEMLENAGVSVEVDLPGVGLNLQDHIGVPVVVESAVPPPGRPSRWLTAAVQYALFRNGVMASNCCESGCFLGGTSASPALEVFTHFQTSRHPRAVEFSVLLMHPQSRGTLTLAPGDPGGPPRIDPRYLDSKADKAILLAGVDRVRSITRRPALQRFGLGAEILPGAGDPDAFLQSNAGTYYHPVGTCRMGSDGLAVVDPRLRVHGVDNLWVVDNSIVPKLTAGHTAATALMIGERAADLMGDDLAHR
jgi:choline dehydrogenase-like flavoprotein